MDKPSKHLSLQYVETLIEAVYVATEATIEVEDGRKKFKYTSAEEVAKAVSTTERRISASEIQQLWFNFGRNRKGFLDDVVYRKKHNIALANPRSSQAQKRRSTKAGAGVKPRSLQKPSDPHSIRLADVDRVLDASTPSAGARQFLAYRNRNK